MSHVTAPAGVLSIPLPAFLDVPSWQCPWCKDRLDAFHSEYFAGRSFHPECVDVIATLDAAFAPVTADDVQRLGDTIASQFPSILDPHRVAAAALGVA